MKQRLVLLIALITLVCTAIPGLAAELDVKTKYLTGVEHFKQSTIRIQGTNKVIYFDPYQADGEPHDADIILISHSHGDHLAVTDMKKIAKPSTIVVVPTEAAVKVDKAGFTKVVAVVPNQSYQVDGIEFKTVPAYNVNKNFHPKSNQWVGYILDFNAVKYYFAGDTDFIPEMKDFKVDVAFLPVGGTYTMTSAEAVQAANLIQPKVAVPIHFTDVVGTLDDAKQFVAGLKPPITGVILKKGI